MFDVRMAFQKTGPGMKMANPSNPMRPSHLVLGYFQLLLLRCILLGLEPMEP